MFHASVLFMHEWLTAIGVICNVVGEELLLKV